MYNVGFNCSLFHRSTLQAFSNNKGRGNDSVEISSVSLIYTNDINPDINPVYRIEYLVIIQCRTMAMASSVER